MNELGEILRHGAPALASWREIFRVSVAAQPCYVIRRDYLSALNSEEPNGRGDPAVVPGR